MILSGGFCLACVGRRPTLRAPLQGIFTSNPASALFKINIRRDSLPQILLLPFSRSTSAGILYLKSCFCPFQDQRPPEFFISNPASALFKINVRRNSLPQFQLMPFSRSTSAGILYLNSSFCLFQDQRSPEFFISNPALRLFKIKLRRNSLPQTCLSPTLHLKRRAPGLPPHCIDQHDPDIGLLAAGVV